MFCKHFFGHEAVEGTTICQSFENPEVSPRKKETPMKNNTSNSKKYEKFVISFLIILFSIYFIGVFHARLSLAAPIENPPGTEAPVDPLQALLNAPVSNLEPHGELYQIYQYNGGYTNARREKTASEVKGKVVVWSLPVEEIDRYGDGYIVKTSETVGFWSWLFGKGVIKSEIRLLLRNSAEKEYIQSLKTSDMITFKGKITGVSSMGRIEINPAVLILK
jgi:hypothetical protein